MFADQEIAHDTPRAALEQRRVEEDLLIREHIAPDGLRAHPLFTSGVDAGGMSMAEPLMPHPEKPDTALDEHPDAPVPEEHGEPPEANDTLTSAGRAHDEGDPLPAFTAETDSQD